MRDAMFELREEHIRLLRGATVLWDGAEAGGPVVLYSPLLGNGGIPHADVAARAGLVVDAPPSDAQRQAIEALVAELPEALRQLIALGLQRHRLLHAAGWRGLAVDVKRPYGERRFYELDMAEILGEAIPSVAQGADPDDGPELPAEQERRLRGLHTGLGAALQALLRHTPIAPGSYPRIGEPPSHPGSWDGDGYGDPRLLVAPVAPAAGEPGDERQPTLILEAFLDAVGRGDLEAAFEGLPKSPLWGDRLDSLRAQVQATVAQYGACLGVERARAEAVTPSIQRLAYVMKLERHFLAWSATFYRPRDAWMLVGLSFKGDVSGLA
jgi:hypothetical protein